MYPPELIRKEALRQDLSPRTIRTYLVCVEQFFRKYQKNPFFINKKDIQEYLDHLLERGAPGNTINVHLNTLKFFYEQVLHKKLTVNIKYSKTAKRLPEFLTKEELISLISGITNQKHRFMIELMYGTGMRVSELLNLKIKDFSFEQNYGWVRQGKGNKDRLFILPRKLKESLLILIKSEHLAADDWLFNSNRHKQYSASSLREIIKEAKRRSKLNKNVHPHTLRHSFATHLIQNGYAVTEVQPLLGHSRLETTMIYVHMASPQLLNIKSPYDQLEMQGGNRKTSY